MTTIAKSIKALNEDNNNSHEFVIYGKPTTETEYQQNVKYVSGADDNGSAIFSDTQPYTWQQVSTKQAELQADYDAKQYQRNREVEYNKKSTGEQLDMIYWDKVNNTNLWSDWIASIKSSNPKS
jgi:hypothetical protein